MARQQRQFPQGKYILRSSRNSQNVKQYAIYLYYYWRGFCKDRIFLPFYQIFPEFFGCSQFISYFCIVMKIFTANQIHELDKYTIEHEPVKSIDLMERAARAMTRTIVDRWSADVPVFVFAGPGNNGGDALAIARMLTDLNYQVTTYLFNISGHLSADCA